MDLGLILERHNVFQWDLATAAVFQYILNIVIFNIIELIFRPYIYFYLTNYTLPLVYSNVHLLNKSLLF